MLGSEKLKKNNLGIKNQLEIHRNMTESVNLIFSFLLKLNFFLTLQQLLF